MSNIKPTMVYGKPIAGGAYPAIITPLVGRTPAEVMDELTAILPKKPDLLEWRIDFFEAIGDTARVIETARTMKAAAGSFRSC